MCGTPHSSRITSTGCCKPGSFNEPSISASDRRASSLRSFGGAADVCADEPLQATESRDSAHALKSVRTTEERIDISPSLLGSEDRAMPGCYSRIRGGKRNLWNFDL